MPDQPPPVFNRSGLAALSDLQTSSWRELFCLLEESQAEFLAHEKEFRSPEYIWPRDPLHTWSRVWEYPYVYHHLRQWRQNHPAAASPLVVDVGSGVTFFPFAVARLGYQVVCTDVDPVCQRDLNRAIEFMSAAPGSVEFRPTDGSILPFKDQEADCLYCISVLEHLEAFQILVAEMNRILQPGGLLILTIDLDPKGQTGFGVEKQKLLREILEPDFADLYPARTIHPADILEACRGPCPMKKCWPTHCWQVFRRRIVKRLLRRKPLPLPEYHLSIEAVIMTKR